MLTESTKTRKLSHVGANSKVVSLLVQISNLPNFNPFATFEFYNFVKAFLSGNIVFIYIF